MGSLINLFHKSGNGKHWRAKDVLEEAIKGLDEGKCPPDSCAVVIMLDKKGEAYDTSVIQCGLSKSELIALMEIVKLDAHKRMNEK